jgi:NTE family protein
VAHAVTASAAYPAFLPALDETLNFSKGDIASSHRVCLTDGGVYDNLGLSPLWPDRKPEISLNVDRYDRIICCRAGYGLSIASPTHFWPSRMYASVDSLFERTQNAGLARLFDLWRGGKIRQILLPYLGQEDARLKFPPDELIRREDIVDYPTNFSSMSVEWIDRLVLRGEQITRALLQEHGWQTEPDATGP